MVKILHIKRWKDGAGKKHAKTLVLLEDGLEAHGYGDEWVVGDEVNAFHDDRWNQVKIQKPRKTIDNR